MAADRDNQSVVVEEVPPHQFDPSLVQVRRELGLALFTVEPDQFADAIVEMVPMGLSREFHRAVSRPAHLSAVASFVKAGRVLIWINNGLLTFDFLTHPNLVGV
jgi:hypothetical protein